MLGTPDLLIAAIARTLGLPLATSNTKHLPMFPNLRFPYWARWLPSCVTSVTMRAGRNDQDRVMASAPPKRYTCEMAKSPLSNDRSEVGVRELRDHLSAWLEAVAAGREITVTDRGKPVARIVPVTGRSKLDRLIAEGLVVPASRPVEPANARPPIPVADSVSDLVIEQRTR
jgi:prevent-host-death family protein